MRFKTNCALGGMICALALSTLGMARADDAEVKLARTYKANDSRHYKQTIKTSVAGMDIVLTAVNKETVKEIKQTGDAVIVRENESTKMELNGSPQDAPTNPPVTFTYDKSGKLVDYKSGNAGGFFDPGVEQLLAIAHNILMPDKAVKKDDKWENELDDPAVKNKKMTLKGAFLGTEKRDGKDLWKVKQSLEAPIDDAGGKATFEITALLDPADGQVVHAEGAVKDLPTTQVGAISWTEEGDVVKPDADKKVAETDKKADGDAKKP